MEKFDFDDVQAAAIVAFRLGQLAGLEIQKIHNEMEELQSKLTISMRYSPPMKRCSRL